jgi:hypothetical protein
MKTGIHRLKIIGKVLDVFGLSDELIKMSLLNPIKASLLFKLDKL